MSHATPRPARLLVLTVITVVMSLLTVVPSHATTGNDSYDGATPIGALPALLLDEDNQDATDVPGDPVPDCPNPGNDNNPANTVWFSVDLAANVEYQIDTYGSYLTEVIGLFSGPTAGTAVQQACADYRDPVIRFTPPSDATYRIGVAGRYGARHLFELSVRAVGSLPNDAHSTPTPLTVGTPLEAQTNRTATNVAGDPVLGCGTSPGATVWYAVPLTAGQQHVISIDAPLGFHLGLYRGPAGSAAAHGCVPRHSTLRYTPASDETVLIGVAGDNGAQRTFSVSAVVAPHTPPANDTRAGAELLSLPASLSVDNSTASNTGDDPLPACADAQHSLWYAIDVEAGAPYEVRMSPLNDGPAAAIYSEDQGQMTLEACADWDGLPLTHTPSSDGRLFISVSSAWDRDIVVDLVVEGGRPANDAFVDATVIPGPLPATLPDESNHRASHVDFDPFPSCVTNSSPLVWYRVDLEAGQRYRIQSASLDQFHPDTVMSVFRGTDPGTATEVDCVRSWAETSAKAPSRLYLTPPTAGTYTIGVAGLGETVPFRLDVAPSDPHPNDAYADATPLTLPAAITDISTVDATQVPGDPKTGCGPDFYLGNIRWWTVEMTAGVQYEIDTGAVDYPQRQIGVFQGADAPSAVQVACDQSSRPSVVYEPIQTGVYRIGLETTEPGVGGPQGGGTFSLNVREVRPPDNDSYAAATPLGAYPVSLRSSNYYATDVPGDPVPSCGTQPGSTVWHTFDIQPGRTYQINAAGDFTSMAVAVYAGATAADATELTCGVTSTRVLSETSTTLVVGVANLTGPQNRGPFDLTIHELVPPPNDRFNDREALGAPPIRLDDVSMANASDFPGDPAPCNNEPSHPTVWYSVDLTGGTQYEVSTLGSQMDTLLGLYGAEGDNLVLLACNDEGYAPPAPHGDSRIVVAAEDDVTLAIGVSNLNGGASFDLSITELVRPANDLFEDATPVGQLPALLPDETNVGATDTNDPVPDCAEPGPAGDTVWYRADLEAGREYQIDTLGSGMDTVVSVFTLGEDGAPVQAACNDQLPDSGTEGVVRFTPDSSGSHTIGVSTKGDVQGAFRLQVTDVTPPVLSIGDVTVSEADDGVALLTVEREGSTLEEVSVSFTTVNGTALAGEDYETTAGTLSLRAGAAQATISVPLIADAVDEEDETFTVELLAPQKATIGRGVATVTITEPTDPSDGGSGSGGGSTGGGSTGGGSTGGGSTGGEPTTPAQDDGPGFTTIAPPEDPSGNSDLSVAVSQLRSEAGASFAQQGGTEVLLASETVFADALASGALQGTRNLLLTDPDQLEDAVLAEIQRLGVATVRVLGGPAAVSDAVVGQLEIAGLEVVRTFGPTRLETAAAIGRVDGTSTSVGYLARAFGDAAGEDPTRAFADSLALGGWAASTGGRVLLTATESLSGPAAQALEEAELESVTIVGGEAAVGPDVHEAAMPLTGAIDRTAGPTRAGTAVAIAEARGFSVASPAPAVVVVDGFASNGWAAGFVMAGLSADMSAPVLLANGDSLPEETVSFLTDRVTPAAGDQSLVCAASAPACDEAARILGLG